MTVNEVTLSVAFIASTATKEELIFAINRLQATLDQLDEVEDSWDSWDEE